MTSAFSPVHERLASRLPMPACRKASPNDTTAHLGFEAEFGKEYADTFRNVQHPGLRADYTIGRSKAYG